MAVVVSLSVSLKVSWASVGLREKHHWIFRSDQQVLGDTAKQLSERFGKVIQNRESISINSSETSLSKLTQLDQAVPASTISALSYGEFVGMVADTPDRKIAFHAEIINDHKALKREEESYRPIPKVREITQEEVEENYRSIKCEVEEIIRREMERVFDTPELGI